MSVNKEEIKKGGNRISQTKVTEKKATRERNKYRRKGRRQTIGIRKQISR